MTDVYDGSVCITDCISTTNTPTNLRALFITFVK